MRTSPTAAELKGHSARPASRSGETLRRPPQPVRRPPPARRPRTRGERHLAGVVPHAGGNHPAGPSHARHLRDALLGIRLKFTTSCERATSNAASGNGKRSAVPVTTSAPGTPGGTLGERLGGINGRDVPPQLLRERRRQQTGPQPTSSARIRARRRRTESAKRRAKARSGPCSGRRHPRPYETSPRRASRGPA